MEVFGDEQQLCPCYEECQEFQKLVELKDSGLVVYRHRPRTEDIRQAEAVESAVNTPRDVFILYNKKNVKITTSELTSELEKENISCPRCRKIFEHAQKLIQEVKSIDKKMVWGICDHCRKKAQESKKPFCVCDKIVKKFISVKGEEKEDTKFLLKILPLKKRHLRKDTMVNKENQNAYFDFQINRELNSPASRHELEVQQMFSHTHSILDNTELSKTIFKESGVKQAVAFIQPIEPVKISSAHTPHEGENINTIIPGTSLVDSVTTFVETSVGLKELPRPSLKDSKQEEIFEDRPTMDAKETLKRRHDLSLRQMMRFEKDAGVPYSVSKRPVIYETPKIIPWAQKDPTSKYYVESQMDMKIPTLRHGRGSRDPRSPRDLDYVSNRDVKFRSTRASQDSFIAPKKADKYHHDKIKQGFYDSEEEPKKVKNQEDRHIVDEELKLQRSVDTISHKTKKPVQHVAKSKSELFDSTGDVLEHQYSFFFPKVIEKEEIIIKIDVSSSQLIKDTQEKLKEEKKRKIDVTQENIGLQAEREKQRQEEERQKKIELAEKKKLAREEKRLQAEEKQRQLIEDQKKYEEEQRKSEEEQRKLEEGQRKLEEEQNKLAEQKYSEKERKVKGKIQRKSEKEQNKLAKQKYNEKERKVKGKISKVSMVAKKDVIPKSDHRDKTDGVSEKKKIDVRRLFQVKPEKKGNDEVTEKRSKDKSGTLIVKQGKGKESEGKTLTKEPSKALVDISELQKLQAEHLIEKALEKKQLECEPKVAKAKEEAERNAQKIALEQKRIKMQKEHSGANLELVQFKQAAKVPTFAACLLPSDIHPKVRMIHKCNHQHSGKKSSRCQLCADSDLELEVLSLDNKINLTTEKTDIIIGEKIFTYKPRLEKILEPEGVPILFQKEFCVEPDQQLKQIVQIIPQETEPEQKQILLTTIEMEQGTGVIHYALSDRTFIDKGWTMLPTEKVMRKMNVYRMRPAHPEFDWFEHNKSKRLMTYDTGERLAEFDDNGRGRWYYRNGRLALDYYDAEETNTQQRLVIYSSGEPDERGRSHPITILATFDYQGNGVVFDHAGKIRLKYNQTEGVVLDRGIGPVSHWKWHSLNDPPVLQLVMIDTEMTLKDPKILELGSAAERKLDQNNEEMLAIEFDNFIKEKNKKLFQKFKPFQIRMKALKINEHFSLKVLDQATVYLIFRDGSTNLKLNIGMILDHQEIVDTDTAEVGEVSTNLERFPARSDSLAGLQRSVAHAQRYERQHAERERWLRPPQPCASADQLTAAASPPMRLPLRTVPTRYSSSTGYSSRKPTNNLYYDTRLRC